MFFFCQAEDGIRVLTVTGVQTCALPISGQAISRTVAIVPGQIDTRGRVNLTGHDGDRPADCLPRFGRDQGAALHAGLDDDRRFAERGDDPVSLWETSRRRFRARRMLGDDESALANLPMESAMPRRVRHVDAGPEDGGRSPSGV